MFSVPRSDEFSPLKNAPGTGVDCPETSRRDLYQQSVRFVQMAGGIIQVVDESSGVEPIIKSTTTGDASAASAPAVPIFEISALVSFDGEGLDAIKGKTIRIDKPTHIADIADLIKLAS